jgi:DNA-directed RNA polymerase subunit RPC12/RpoP
MSSQSLKILSQPMHAPQQAAVFCTRCKTMLQVADPMEKFTRYCKITCPHCGQPHRMDLYFLGERDCFDLVPIRRQPATNALDEDV